MAKLLIRGMRRRVSRVDGRYGEHPTGSERQQKEYVWNFWSSFTAKFGFVTNKKKRRLNMPVQVNGLILCNTLIIIFKSSALRLLFAPSFLKNQVCCNDSYVT